MLKKLLKFIRKNVVLCVALAAAGITSIIVPPDEGYLGYFDVRTLTCLFCTLAVINALEGISFFRIVSEKIVMVFKNTRSAILALVYITFLGSMLIANDMALLTFLPLGYFVLTSTRKSEYMAFTFVMQTIAANLGGMLTPFGNPQNLYLYSYFNIPTDEFMKIMFPPFIISVTIITVVCLFIKKEELSLEGENKGLDIIKATEYIVLFLFTLLIVFRIVSPLVGLFVTLVALLILDRRALLKVDYPLLLTFCAFFIFAGNMARIDVVKNFLGALIDKNPLIFGVLSCQVISNVPSAVLLSKFTTNYPALLIAVNIGGAGTLIASLASLITLREYSHHFPDLTGKYVLKYTLYNFAILAVLVAVMWVYCL